MLTDPRFATWSQNPTAHPLQCFPYKLAPACFDPMVTGKFHGQLPGADQPTQRVVFIRLLCPAGNYEDFWCKTLLPLQKMLERTHNIRMDVNMHVTDASTDCMRKLYGSGSGGLPGSGCECEYSPQQRAVRLLIAAAHEKRIANLGADLVMVIPASGEACQQEKELDAQRTSQTISLYEMGQPHWIFAGDRNGYFDPLLASQVVKQIAQSLAVADLLLGREDDAFGVSDEVCSALRGAFARGGMQGLETSLEEHALNERLTAHASDLYKHYRASDICTVEIKSKQGKLFRTIFDYDEVNTSPQAIRDARSAAAAVDAQRLHLKLDERLAGLQLRGVGLVVQDADCFFNSWAFSSRTHFNQTARALLSEHLDSPRLCKWQLLDSPELKQLFHPCKCKLACPETEIYLTDGLDPNTGSCWREVRVLLASPDDGLDPDERPSASAELFATCRACTARPLRFALLLGLATAASRSQKHEESAKQQQERVRAAIAVEDKAKELTAVALAGTSSSYQADEARRATPATEQAVCVECTGAGAEAEAEVEAEAAGGEAAAAPSPAALSRKRAGGDSERLHQQRQQEEQRLTRQRLSMERNGCKRLAGGSCSCARCGGGGACDICEHGRRRTRCKDCGGGGLCEHGRQLNRNCKDCDGGKALPKAGGEAKAPGGGKRKR